jgi:hypothetical protein
MTIPYRVHDSDYVIKKFSDLQQVGGFVRLQ